MKTNADWVHKLASKKWRLNHLYKILNKEGQLVRFKPNTAQKKYIKARGDHRYVKIIKARQKGFTTFHCIDYLDDCLWKRGQQRAILAHELSKVKDIFQIVKRAYDNLPDELRPVTKYDNKNELVFEKDVFGRSLDSKIYVGLKLRSGTVQGLLITESAYIDNRQELKAGSKQAVGMSGSIIEETTANGINEFYKDVMHDLEVWDKDTGYPQEQKNMVYFQSWLDDTEYTLDTNGVDNLSNIEQELKKLGATDGHLAWRRWKVNELRSETTAKASSLDSESLFKQEYPATLEEAFQSSGDTYISTQIINNLGVLQPVNQNQYTTYYSTPKQDKLYVVAVDPAKGTGNDNSAITVIDCEDMSVCALVKDNQVDPFKLAEIAVEIAQEFNEALLIIENNILTTVRKAQEIYTNLYYTTSVDKRTDKRTRKIGFTTNLKTRPLILDKLRQIIHNEIVDSLPAEIIAELRTFVNNDNGKPEAASGYHDDTVISLALAYWAREGALKSNRQIFTTTY